MAGSAHVTLDAVSRQRSRRTPAGTTRAARPLAALSPAHPLLAVHAGKQLTGVTRTAESAHALGRPRTRAVTAPHRRGVRPPCGQEATAPRPPLAASAPAGSALPDHARSRASAAVGAALPHRVAGPDDGTAAVGPDDGGAVGGVARTARRSPLAPAVSAGSAPPGRARRRVSAVGGAPPAHHVVPGARS
ncbi:hypothetical protein AB0B40_28175 [Streptomyces sp. NPDC042638]|uniref:hypothetical protein n=1 Tax=Streptomyces sp. NPDC042638 TaxID=3154333 RepID=UPI0033C20917